MARISVLMPVRNCEGFILETLNSILTQSFSDFEVVVIDDFSTDSTHEQILKVSEFDKRIKVHKMKAHVGFQNALNVGIKLCDCEFVARHDGDDVSLIHRFQRQLDFLSANPDIKLVGTSGLFFNEVGVIKEHVVPVLQREILSGVLSKENTFIHASWLMSRTALDKVGDYNPYILAEDKDYILRFSEQFGISNLREILYKIRVHATSITSTTKYDRMITRSVCFLNFELRDSGKRDLFGQEYGSRLDSDRINEKIRLLMDVAIDAARQLQRSDYMSFVTLLIKIIRIKGKSFYRLKIIQELLKLFFTRQAKRIHSFSLKK